MKPKKIIGIVLIIAGLVILLIGISARGRVANARANLKNTSGLFENNAVGKGFGDAIEGKIDSYDTPVLLALIGGVVLIVVGAGVFIRCCKHHR